MDLVKIIPSSNDYIIVFPMNPSDKKFSRTIYSPEMTNGRASTEEINQTLTSFELAMSQAATKSDFNKSFCQIFRYPFLILWALWALFIPRRSEPFWLCVAVYGLAWIRFHFQNKNSQNSKDDDIQGVLASVQPEYLKKGLRWHIPEEAFEWIELIKEYRESEQSIVTATAVQVYSNRPQGSRMNYQEEYDKLTSNEA